MINLENFPFFEKFFNEKTTENDKKIFFKKIYNQIPNGVKILRQIGEKATKGLLFILSNDYILKFFKDDRSSHHNSEGDIGWYSDRQEELFSGHGSIHDLNILHTNVIESPNKENLKLVIMERIKPFENFLFGRDLDVINEQLILIKQLVYEEKEIHEIIDELRKINKHKFEFETGNNIHCYAEVSPPFNENMVINFFKSFIKAKETGIKAVSLTRKKENIINHLYESYNDFPAKVLTRLNETSYEWYKNHKLNRKEGEPAKVVLNDKKYNIYYILNDHIEKEIMYDIEKDIGYINEQNEIKNISVNSYVVEKIKTINEDIKKFKSFLLKNINFIIYTKKQFINQGLTNDEITGIFKMLKHAKEKFSNRKNFLDLDFHAGNFGINMNQNENGYIIFDI